MSYAWYYTTPKHTVRSPCICVSFLLNFLSDGSLPTISVVFEVTGLELQTGTSETSVYGGGQARIIGQDFPTTPGAVSVSFGYVTTSMVSVTSTEIVVDIGRSNRVHTVTNQGQHTSTYEHVCAKLIATGEYDNDSLALLDYVSRAHEIAICPSSVVRRPSVVRPSVRPCRNYLWT